MGSGPEIRNVRPDEIDEVWRVHVASSSDLAVRRGGRARPLDEPVPGDARVGLASDPDGYFCAVEDGRITGMCSSLVRGRVWYLSMLFVLPGDQSRGVGRAMLESLSHQAAVPSPSRASAVSSSRSARSNAARAGSHAPRASAA